MRVVGLIKSIFSVAGTLLLGGVLLLPPTALAAPATLEPSIQLPGLPEAGAPSFTFSEGANTFGGNIQSWYDNYAVFQNVGGAGGSYNFFAHSTGQFSYLESPDTGFGGVAGILDLNATFDSNGTLQAGGTITITGAIAGIGITDPTTQLMTAELIDFVFDGDKLGFAISNIQCAVEIVGCAKSETQVESVYFGLGGNFEGIADLNGKHYRSTIMSTTTVPLPAAVWLMLSGLGTLLMFRPRRAE
jgi:hypothetical protein